MPNHASVEHDHDQELSNGEFAFFIGVLFLLPFAGAFWVAVFVCWWAVKHA